MKNSDINFDSFEGMFEDAVRAGLIIGNDGEVLKPYNCLYGKSHQYHCQEIIHNLAFKEWLIEVKGREYDNEEYKTLFTKDNFDWYLSIQAEIKVEQVMRHNLDSAERKKDIICRKCMSREEIIKINTCDIAEYIVLNGMSDNEMLHWIKHYCTGEHETSEIYDIVCDEIIYIESDVFPNKAYIDVLRRFRHLIEVRAPYIEADNPEQCAANTDIPQTLSDALTKSGQDCNEAQLSTGNTDDKPKLSFADYLTYNNKDVLMGALHKLLDNQPSGREVATVLEALVEKKYLPKHSRVINAAIAKFSITCKNQAISKYYRKGIIPKEDIQQKVNLLP